MRRADLFTSIGLLCFVALMVFVIIPREAGGGVWHGLSPYFYPAVMLVGVALSSLGLLFQAMAQPDDYQDQSKLSMTWSDLGLFLMIAALIFGSVLVMHAFGTWAGGVVLMASTMIFMGEINPLRIAAVALPTLAITYALITWVLNIPLP
ncbi:MAG: tripartite tricarboxylate transporter TctB family protein [Acetobacteraceae bacterium]|nr:tripartite tricarboxylate transporter TctB family protein [Acetobacteraceae bacterium]